MGSFFRQAFGHGVLKLPNSVQEPASDITFLEHPFWQQKKRKQDGSDIE
jgi:hypothetical protein